MTYLKRLKRGDALAIGGLWLLSLLLILPTLLRPFHIPGRWIVAPFQDIVLFYSFESLIRHAYSAGEWPLWNAYFGAGTPLLGNPQSASLYPLTALFRGLSIPASFSWSYFLHLGLMASGLYVLLRDLKTQIPAAAAGAIAFTLSGAVIPRIGFGEPVLVYGLTWAGWSLWSYRRLLHFGGWTYLLLTCVFNALAIVTGHLQFVAIVLMIPAGYFLAFMIQNRREGRTLLRGTVWSVGVLVFSLGLTAALLLPTIETLPYLWRSDRQITAQEAMGISLNLYNFPIFVVPYLWFDLKNDVSIGYGLFHELSPYTGLLTLIVAPAALLGDSQPRRQLAYYLVGLTVTGLLLAISGSPLYVALHSLLPIFRVSGRFVIVPAFGLSLLGALGLDAILRGPHTIRIDRRLLVAIPGLAGIGAVVWLVAGVSISDALADRGLFTYLEPGVLYHAQAYNLVRLLVMCVLVAGLFWLKDRIAMTSWAWAAVAVLLIDMAAFAGPLVRPYDARNIERDDHVLNRLDVEPTDMRIRFFSRLPPVYGLPTVSENDSVRLATYDRIRETDEALGAQPTRGRALLSASYSYFEEGEAVPEGEPAFVGDGVTVYADSENIPRLYAAPAVHTVRDDDDAYQYVAYQAIEEIVARPVITSSGTGPDLPTESDPDADPPTIMVIDYEMTHLAIEVTSDQPVLLVLNDMYYPGWEAQVDGQPTTIWKTNYTFRGVEVPAGTHLIEMAYTSLAFKRGLTISLASLALLVGGLLVGALRGRIIKPDLPADSER